MAFAALFVCYVLAPEYKRTKTMERLFSQNVIQAPIVVMFGGRPNTPAPVPEPRWFSIRQSIANSFGRTVAKYAG